MASRPRQNLARSNGWIVIVGFGRLGTALALQLRRRHWRVAVAANRASARQRARRLRFPLANPKIIEKAAVLFLSVPDPDIASAAKQFDKLARDAALVHCAGALSLEVFSGAVDSKRAVGSFHPLCAISSPSDTFDGYSVAIAAKTARLRTLLRRIAQDLGLHPLAVRDDRRSLYHAGAVLSAPGLIALADASVELLESADVPRPAATRALLALMRSALHGAEARGLARGLTGPVPRGDTGTIRRHWAALPPDLRSLYADLGLRALKLVSKEISDKDRRDLFQILHRRDDQ